ncbi:uncharacterized protein LOC114399915 isoform X1 [Glycine soja]|uniref:uncharacterized protein LOC114399915 isoform X1 n=1 Tax=Glycine soja TaxID=3848 RepID=UPI00103C0C49|nr:uncharacterized protein LOC114399915 isoform X1 [Glycine soja]
MEPNQFETYVLAVPRTRSNLSSSNNQEVIVIPDVESQNRVQEDGSNKRRRTEEEGEAAAASHSKDINEPLVCPICMDIWTSRRRTSHLIIQSLEAKSTALESKDNDWRKKEAEWHKREASLHLQVEKLTQEPRRWNSFIEH